VCNVTRERRTEKTAPAFLARAAEVFLGVCAGDAERETPQTEAI
jgi:hypothetical protein